MSILFRSRPVEERSTIDAIGALARNSRMSYGPGGVSVNDDSAMRHDAVWACTTRIAQDVSMMPADVVRYVNGTRVPVDPSPQVISAPSVQVRALDWRYQVIMSLLRSGNAWGVVTSTNGNGVYPTRIELLQPSQVTMTAGRIMVNGEERFRFPEGDIWHMAAYTMPGSWVGLSPIEYHRQTIGLGMAAGRFGESFFNDGGHPNAIVGIEGEPTVEQAQSLKDKLMSITRGNRELIVLPKSTTYTPLSVNPEDSQFIDSQRYTVEQICRIYGEDPADYGASGGGKGSLTYANRSDADLARFKRRQFWVTKLQDALTDLLPRPQVVKLNTSAVLMMTDKERHEIHALRLKSFTTTVNEVRKLEDDTPFGVEYDEPGLPSVAQPGTSVQIDTPVPARSSEDRQQSFAFNFPEQRFNVDIPEQAPPVVHVDGAVVNVPAPEVRFDVPAITVNPTPVTVENVVNVDPTPVTVDVRNEVETPVVNVTAQASAPTVNVQMPERKSTHRVRRDGDGRITQVIEE